jgi:hypothetical protein
LRTARTTRIAARGISFFSGEAIGQCRQCTQGRYVAYYRVSTDRQGKTALGIDAQKEKVKAFLDGGRWSLVKSFTEVESGTRKGDRPELRNALDYCKRNKGTKLVVATLSRLTRDTKSTAGPSASLCLFAKRMDCRVRPGNDFVTPAVPSAPAGGACAARWRRTACARDWYAPRRRRRQARRASECPWPR